MSRSGRPVEVTDVTVFIDVGDLTGKRWCQKHVWQALLSLNVEIQEEVGSIQEASVIVIHCDAEP